jgi:hypothetical protein
VTKYPQRFKNQAEFDEYLSLVYALDGDPIPIVQRRRDGTATKEELALIDDIVLRKVKPSKVKIRKAMKRDAIAFAVLLEHERLRRRWPDMKQGYREPAKELVGERFHVGHDTIDKALKQFGPEKTAFAEQYIANYLNLVEPLDAAPETFNPEHEASARFRLLNDQERDPRSRHEGEGAGEGIHSGSLCLRRMCDRENANTTPLGKFGDRLHDGAHISCPVRVSFAEIAGDGVDDHELHCFQFCDFFAKGFEVLLGKPLSNMALLMMLRRIGRSDVTTHGFRSSFRTWAAECTGFPREIVKAALAHVIGNKVEAAYQRGDLLDKRRELMAEWGSIARTRPAQQEV